MDGYEMLPRSVRRNRFREEHLAFNAVAMIIVIVRDHAITGPRVLRTRGTPRLVVGVDWLKEHCQWLYCEATLAKLCDDQPMLRSYPVNDSWWTKVHKLHDVYWVI